MSVDVAALTTALATEVDGGSGAPSLSATALSSWRQRFAALPVDDQEPVAVAVVAMAVRAHDALGDNAVALVEQLALLAATALHDPARVGVLFERQRDDRTAAVTGRATTTKLPAPTSAPKTSALDVRLGAVAKKPTA